MANEVGQPDFDALYRDEPVLTPWDIGAPQSIVQQLVAFGGVRGTVLDPGTGPGHHAIHYASKGYAVTGSTPHPRRLSGPGPTPRVPGSAWTSPARFLCDGEPHYRDADVAAKQVAQPVALAQPAVLPSQ